jgi:acetyltransferase-like isoleucine patch superfamily enzyme
MFGMLMPANSLVILGAGGHGHDIKVVAEDSYDYYSVYFLDDNLEKFESKGTINQASYMNRVAHSDFIIGANWPKEKEKIWWNANVDIQKYTNIIHKSVTGINRVNYHVFGHGIYIGANTSLGYNVRVADHAHIGAGVTATRTSIGMFSAIGPGANICGDVLIGDFVTVGAGATISNLIKIGHGAIIGAGAVVLKDVEPGAKMVGVPARRIN